jgi:hypothetical protein
MWFRIRLHGARWHYLSIEATIFQEIAMRNLSLLASLFSLCLIR